MFHYRCGNPVRKVPGVFTRDTYSCPSCGNVHPDNIMKEQKDTFPHSMKKTEVPKKKKSWIQCPDCRGMGWYDRNTRDKLSIEGDVSCKRCGGSGRCLNPLE